MVKTRFQLQVGKGAPGEGYTSIMDCFRKIVRQEGYVPKEEALVFINDPLFLSLSPPPLLC